MDCTVLILCLIFQLQSNPGLRLPQSGSERQTMSGLQSEICVPMWVPMWLLHWLLIHCEAIWVSKLINGNLDLINRLV